MNINIFIDEINKLKMKRDKRAIYIKYDDNGYRFSFKSGNYNKSIF